MDADEIKQLQRQVSKLQLEAKLRKSVANELERQKNLVQKARDEAEEQRVKFEKASKRLSQYLSPQICEQILGAEEFSGLETSKKKGFIEIKKGLVITTAADSFSSLGLG